jgi:GWxTD domain-containing protein
VPSSWFESQATWLLTLWLIGACLLLTRSVAAWLRARRLVSRQLTPLPAEISRAAERLAVSLGVKRVRFHSSARVASALVFGWLKPVIVLPAAAIGRLSEAEIEALLAHELAHVMRQDFFVNLLQTFVECALFYHPCVWWVSARMRHERELCCDDVAVAVCRDEILYSKALLRLEELRMEPALAATGGRLRDRIQRLLNTPETRRISAAPVVALALLIGVSVALVAQNPPPAPEPPAPPPSAAPTGAKAPEPPVPPHAPGPPPVPPTDAQPGFHDGQAPPPPPPPGAGPGGPDRAPLPPGHAGGPMGRSPDMRTPPPPGGAPDGPGHGPGPMGRSADMRMLSPQQMEEQRAAMEKARQEMAADRAAMEKTRQDLSMDRAARDKARQELEAAMKEQAAKMQSDAGPELRNKKMEELRQRLQGLARAEAEKAKLLADQASKEADLAGREAALARIEADRDRFEADMARRQADRASGVADFKHHETDQPQPAARGEQDQRTKYANEKWASQGGASSDKGKAYIKYGPPDEIKTGSSGETWLYKDEAKDRTRREVTFDGDGKGQWVKQTSSAGPIGSSLSSHFHDVPELR